MKTRNPAIRTRYGLALASFVLIVGSAAPASAQVEPATGIADPGRAQQQLMERDYLPALAPRVEVKNLILQNVPPGAENVRLTLNSLQLEGVSAYSESQLRPVYGDKLGTEVTLAEIYGIASAMTTKYRNDGYILTQVIVPPQTIEGGVVKLRVVEGYVDNIQVEGAGNENEMLLVRNYASHMQSKQALNVDDLERYLLLINDLPGIEARSILSPSPSQTGAANMRIIVERDPYDALLAVDNYGSRYLGPIQLTAAGSLNSVVFNNNERITGQMVIAPNLVQGGDLWDETELAYFALSYEQPVWRDGTTIEIFASHTATWPGYTLEPFDVAGRSQFFSVEVEHPFIRSRSYNVKGRATLDWRNVRSSNNIEPTRKDKIRAVRTGVSVEFLDRLFGVGINNMDLEIAQGLDILGASDKGDANLTRAMGDPQFFKAEATVQRLQRVTSSVNLLLAGRGQWTNDNLLSSEEFGLGGYGTARGYDPSEVVGDSGVAGRVEVQWKEPYEVSAVNDYQLFGFFDAGHVWNGDATTSDLKSETLTSTGFGVRTDVFDAVKADFTLAFPLNHNVETLGDDDPRAFMSVSKRF